MANGRRVSLADLAADEPSAEARVPALAAMSRPVPIETIAANPLNTRDLDGQPAKIVTIAESMRINGQLQPCAAVTRGAFLRIFPEHELSIGGASIVLVTGARRRMAALQAGIATLKVDVMDNLAGSRQQFLGATASENLDREDLDLIEEARAVELLVKECGTGKAAAEQLSRTPGWATQRLNLLKLAPEVQAALRAREIPFREVRDLHRLEVAEQLAALAAWRAKHTEVEGNDDPASASDQGTGVATGRPKISPAASAIRRLGGTPARIADSLRTQMKPDEIRELVVLLTAEA